MDGDDNTPADDSPGGDAGGGDGAAPSSKTATTPIKSGNSDGSPSGASGNGSLDAILEQLDEDGRKAVRAELERARGDAAKYRTRAAKFGDIDPEKAKAALSKLDELEAASKTAEQQAAERAASAEKDRDSARKELWRERAGRTHKLSDAFTALLTGDTEEAINDKAQAIAQEISDRLEAAGRRPGDAVPKTPAPKTPPGAGDSEPFDAAKIAEQAIARM